jgi:hypothetical protein
VFSSSTLSYQVSVGNLVSSVVTTGVAVDSTAQVVVSGGSSLVVGSNTVTVTVTAQDGVSETVYTVTVIRVPPRLSSLSLSSGVLSPVFSSSTLSYQVSVGNLVSSVVTTGVAVDSTAQVVVSGGSSLVVGSNTVTVTVTAQDGVSETVYTVTVTRAASSVSGLSGLSLSSGVLSPVFSSSTLSYQVSVGNLVSSVVTTGVAVEANASVVVSGGSSLVVGSNTVTVTVTAQDGVSETVYTVTVTRAASSVSGLSGLSLSSGVLSPVFSSSTLSYQVSVGNLVSSVVTTGVAVEANASVVVSGGSSLVVGSNTVTVTVTAQDGVSETIYTVTVTRAEASETPVVAPVAPVYAPAVAPLLVPALTSPKLTASKSASAKSIASFARLKVFSTSKVSLKVVPSSSKFCKVSGTTLKGLKAGSCKVTVTVIPRKGRATSKTVTLKVTK